MHSSTERWLRLVEKDYLEIPGLNLTRPQMQRLWGLDAATCDVVLGALESARFLQRTSRGSYVLAAAVERFAMPGAQ
jgi:hypothetical protein